VLRYGIEYFFKIEFWYHATKIILLREAFEKRLQM
jgi:hypothetical protein